MGYAPDELRDKALAAVEEVAKQSKSQALVRTKALAFSLAYLWTHCGESAGPLLHFGRRSHSKTTSDAVKGSMQA